MSNIVNLLTKMSLQKARAKYYAEQFDNSDSSDEEHWSDDHMEESSEEEYISKVNDPHERLRARLMKIQKDFARAAPHAVAAEKFHIQERSAANPIQSALEKPVPERISMSDADILIKHNNFLAEVANHPGFEVVSTSQDNISIGHTAVVTGDYNIAVGYNVCRDNIPESDDVPELEDSSVEDMEAVTEIEKEDPGFYQWLTDKFGPANVPSYDEYHEEANISEESWGEWPETDNYDEAIPLCEEPNPMDMKGNQIAKKIAGLQAELKKIEENNNVLIVEKENLSNQLDACMARIDELTDEYDNTIIAIEDAKEEQARHIEEMDAMHGQQERKKREDDLIKEIKYYMDDFSQAVQILLGSGKYCDFDHLVRSHVRNGMYVNDSVKESIINEAKIYKRDQLYATLEVENCYLSPKNSDGLPNLFDQYITDSYNIVDNI